MRHAVHLLLALVIFGGCQRTPRPLVAGTDACGYCRMEVTDTRFGGEIQLRSGRIYTFDAIECLASFYLAVHEDDEVRGVWVSDFVHASLIPVDSAHFLRGSRIKSPMGRSLVAFATAQARGLAAEYGGDAMRWGDVVAFMRTQQFVPSADSAHRHPNADVGGVSHSDTIVVEQGSSVPTITRALASAQPGSRIVVRPGVYREPTLRITVPLTLDGGNAAVLDGEGAHSLIDVAADDVTVRGFVMRNTGVSHLEDRAALRVSERSGCRIEHNRVENAFFAIYLSRVADCTVAHNDVRGSEQSQTVSGNGIHVWQSERVHITDNTVSGHRDGIYFEFVKASLVHGNVSERSDRYGLHFMFSDDCRYENNVFRANGAGVAVMYTKRVQMLANRFERNWGSNAYGLLLKDINDSEIKRNAFVGNSIGLHLEGANRNRIEENEFRENGWALRVLANAQENVVTRNVFSSNSFDVATNSRQNFSTFRENYWDRYRGYDLDRDGIGDVPHAPVRLFALVVEQSPAALVLQRSVIVDLLDLAERVLPVLTPATLIDEQPLMRRPSATAAVRTQ